MENYERAKNLLNANLTLLHRLAKELLDREVLDNSEIEKIINEVSPLKNGSDKEVSELST